MKNILTIDVEDWRQSSIDVLEKKGWKAGGRPRPSPRVVENTLRLLDLLAEFDARATCFILGSVAEAYPSLVRRIAEAGHEAATHGYGHELVYNLDRERFRSDLSRSKELIEDILGREVRAYRAPYFSITPSSAWALDVLRDCGITFDSSMFPIRRGLYGFPSCPRFPHSLGLANGGSLFELPVSTFRVLGQNIPFGGGGYFRLAPYGAVKKAVESINGTEQAAVFYLHPYELDTRELHMPMPAENRRVALFRWSQRLNREKTEPKLRRLLSDFAWTSIAEWADGGKGCWAAVSWETKGWQDQELQWDRHAEALRQLFASVWPDDLVVRKEYFEWQFLQGPKGKPVAYCVQPEPGKSFLAGVYLVMPATLLVADRALDFSTSVYTATHPEYQRQGIFSRLALLTYEKCKERSISGTVGIPNNNSLPGFRALGFSVLGQMAVVARTASPAFAMERGRSVKEFSSPDDFDGLDCSLDQAKARSGTVLFSRGADFLTWRYLNCPGIRYRIFGAVDRRHRLTGLVVLRSAMKKGLRLTVVVDFLVNRTAPGADAAARALLRQAHRFALKNVAPVLVALTAPFSYEAGMLAANGFKKLSRKLLPHDSNLILKLHSDELGALAPRLTNFRNWHFTFGDYDIF